MLSVALVLEEGELYESLEIVAPGFPRTPFSSRRHISACRGEDSHSHLHTVFSWITEDSNLLRVASGRGVRQSGTGMWAIFAPSKKLPQWRTESRSKLKSFSAWTTVFYLQPPLRSKYRSAICIGCNDRSVDYCHLIIAIDCVDDVTSTTIGFAYIHEAAQLHG